MKKTDLEILREYVNKKAEVENPYFSFLSCDENGNWNKHIFTETKK